MNKVILMGNLGNDPELRNTNSGNSVLNLRLATTERYKDNSGQWTDRTEWHNVVVWGNRAEALSRFLRKGSKILVEGSLQTRKWEDRNGNDRYQTEVNAREVEMCDRREQGGQRQQPRPPPAVNPPTRMDDDDIPF